MLTRLGAAVDRLMPGVPWTNVYGLARTLLALGTAGTLIFSPTPALFAHASGAPQPPYCDAAARISIYCIAPHHSPAFAQWGSVAILMLAASGWRPRWTAIPHWWVAFSFSASSSLVDGGDQVTAVLTLLILPIALTDSRSWHWARPPDHDADHDIQRVIAATALTLLRLQLFGIYLDACIAKLGVREWQDGTDLYYWLHDPSFGPPGWLHPITDLVVSSSAGVSALTWGTLVLEFSLAMGIVASRRLRRVLLPAGVLLHIGIALAMGLVSFGLAMIAGLICYLRPLDEPFPIRKPTMARAARARLRRVHTHVPRAQNAPIAAGETPVPTP